MFTKVKDHLLHLMSSIILVLYCDSISRLYLENFMNFEHFEIFPRKGVNMIFGPNGSGKV